MGSRFIIISAISILSLLFIWIQLSSDQKSAQSLEISALHENLNQSNNALLRRIESLQQELSYQQSISQQHANRLALLEQQPPITQPAAPQTADTNPHEGPGESSDSFKPASLREKLLDSNIAPETISLIQQRVGQNRLARLELRDQAIREDWLDTPEYFEKEQQLAAPTGGLREEFGDRVYDQYLYASGRPNRVVVREVFSGSAAKVAGVEPGDIILSYANDSIYAMSEIQQATTEGIADETVLIEILRDDLPYSTSVPRGPLGISMTIIRKQPE